MSNRASTIITDQTNFQIDTKLISIHSDDRDKTKWPSASLFEIELPQEYYSVQTIRMLNINFLSQEYVFSYYNQNTKFTFSITSLDKEFTVTISDGNYDGNMLASEIQYQMNMALDNYLDDSTNKNIHKQSFSVAYNDSNHKIYFGNLHYEFKLLFNKQEEYSFSCNLSKTNYAAYYNIYESSVNSNSKQKGLYSYIGYENIEYISTPVTNNQVFGYSNYTWLDINNNEIKIGYIIREFIPGKIQEEKIAYQIDTIDVHGELVFFMEIEKYNNCDELIKNPKYSSSLSDPNNTCFKNTYGGKVDGFFSKIITFGNDVKKPMSQSINGMLHNASRIFTPPLQNLRKLKFRFRYHDGRLVNFLNQSINFTLEVNSIRNEMRNEIMVNKPIYKGF